MEKLIIRGGGLALLFVCLWLFQPALAQTNKRLAYQAYQARNLLEAKELIDTAVNNEAAKDAEAWLYRGNICFNMIGAEEFKEQIKGKFIDLEAYNSYKRALELDKSNRYRPQIIEDYFQLCIDFLSAGNDAYDRGLSNRNAPGDLRQAAKYYEAFMDMYNQLGSNQGAMRKIMDESGLDVNTIIFFTAISHDRTDNNARAVELYEFLAKRDFNEPDVYARMKNIYIEQNQSGKALAMLKRAFEKFRDNAEYGLEYSRLLADNNKFKEAESVAKQAIKMDRNSCLGLVALAEVYEKQQRWGDAEAQFKLALAKEGDEFLANYYFGKYWFRRGKATMAEGAKVTTAAGKPHFLESLKYLEEAYRINPFNQKTRDDLLAVFDVLGETRKAEDMRARAR